MNELLQDLKKLQEERERLQQYLNARIKADGWCCLFHSGITLEEAIKRDLVYPDGNSKWEIPPEALGAAELFM